MPIIVNTILLVINQDKNSNIDLFPKIFPHFNKLVIFVLFPEQPYTMIRFFNIDTNRNPLTSLTVGWFGGVRPT